MFLSKHRLLLFTNGSIISTYKVGLRFRGLPPVSVKIVLEVNDTLEADFIGDIGVQKDILVSLVPRH